MKVKLSFNFQYLFQVMHENLLSEILIYMKSIKSSLLDTAITSVQFFGVFVQTYFNSH